MTTEVWADPAEGLAAFGFARVLARPRQPATWVVIAVDEGPYPADTVGYRTIDAVGRQAAILARRYGGYPDGGSRCEPSMLHHVDTAPIERTNPGMRPPIPAIVVTPEPPPAALASTPDVVVAGVADMSRLRDIDWAGLSHAHGSADDVPDLVRALAQNDDRWPEILDALFGDDLLHQGSCYSATAPALPFVIELLASGILPVSRRLDLFLWLLYAADRWAESLLVDAARAAAHNRLPQAAAWTRDVHLAVETELPSLLARWDAEPRIIQYVLACLAAHYPHHGRLIIQQVSDMASDYVGTQPGDYLRLAVALLRGDDTQVPTIAGDIVGWAVNLDPGWLDASSVSPALKATHILATGAYKAASHKAVSSAGRSI
ncbi:hypothetical protein [Actinophytocola glycyrrhizae]|uniref:DUF4192 family protein n=1 Tax=Actinophytocola glycyrrhizae TaxID=2044873 RepID=A0ABV9S5U7_9PSEU